MDISLRDRFTDLYQKYFPGAELPLALEYRDGPGTAQQVPPPDGWRCLICQLGRARNGTPLAFGAGSVTCGGGKMYAGFSQERPPGFRFFLSYGKEGIVEGERYKKSPEVVDAWEKMIPPFDSSEKHLVFTRWDQLTEADNPAVVVFFARPEVISGLFTLANFDRSDPYGVVSPMGAGCATIVYYPWLEQQKDDPMVVMGMFDPSARKCVPLDVMTIAFPMKRFEKIVGYIEESFLITPTWETVKKKIERSGEMYRK